MKVGADTEVAEAAGGRTALHFAALRSDAAAVKALVLAGAETELRDRDGRTPLHLSIIVPPSKPSAPLYLLEVAGAAGSTPDAFGMTALDIAVRYGRSDVVRTMFREIGAAPLPCPANGGLLYDAVRGGDAGIVGALVGAGWEAGVPPPRAQSSKSSRETAPAGCGPAPPANTSAASSSSTSSAAAGSPASAAATPAGGGETLSPLMLAADR